MRCIPLLVHLGLILKQPHFLTQMLLAKKRILDTKNPVKGIDILSNYKTHLNLALA